MLTGFRQTGSRANLSMRRRAHRRPFSGLILVALLLVPLAVRSHAHPGHRVSATCAVCIAAHHTPSVATPAPALSPVVAETFATSTARTDVVDRHHRSPHAGRAPPSPSLVQQR
jgi:hypothetical protein